MIADLILSSKTCYNCMGKRGHFCDGISLELGDDIEGIDICDDWTVTFYEYDIVYQHDGSVCCLSEIDEKCFGIVSVSIFYC